MFKDDKDKLRYYFCHNRQSVEIIDHLEAGYDWDGRDPAEGLGKGLNLTRAVREGLLVHNTQGYRGPITGDIRSSGQDDKNIKALAEANSESGMYFPGSLEAQVVRIADDIAQRIHDLEDGMRSNLLTERHIAKTVRDFLGSLRGEMFDDHQIFLEERELIHKKYETRISKAFLDHVVSMLGFEKNDKDEHKRCEYSSVPEETVKAINYRLKNDDNYREDFLRAGMVAFLLHMWRNETYLDRLDAEEQARVS